ncbi:MAG: transcription termination/antitermination protein NusA [Lachnospiraceae bacterium]|nr:transcription termination/antitermination protein NusA [Lachnospiraceae bacterium]
MNSELMDALETLERDKEISKESILNAIKDSLVQACKNHFKSADNIRVDIDDKTGELHVIATKEVIELADDVMDPAIEISWDEAKEIDPEVPVGGFVEVEINSKEFGRIATQNAKNVITQKLREEERNVIYRQFAERRHEIITGVVQRRVGRGFSINLGKTDALLPDQECVPGERLKQGGRIKVYVLEVLSTPKGAKITVSRSHPELVRRLFEEEVTEIKDGTVEIMNIAREAGSRTKMAVMSHNPNVDPVGACVGVNGSRVNAIVNELYGEKIDIISWSENPGELIQNSLSPARIVNVFADPEEKTANVVVPDTQLSLAIGKSGQNARLAAKLTGFKIDIKSESQAVDAEGFRIEDYLEDEYDEYEEGEYAEGEYAEEGYAEGEYVAEETASDEGGEA